MMLKPLARELLNEIGSLDCLLIPLAHTAQDSHGGLLGTDAELRRRLLVEIKKAQIALSVAEAQLLNPNDDPC
jgi:hypothetical protein